MSTQVMTEAKKRIKGANFLVEDLLPEDIFTLEDISIEQKQIVEMTGDFVREKILPKVPEIEAKQYEISRHLLRELGQLGLLGIDVPEEYGGIDMDKVTSALVGQQMSLVGSFSVTFGTHVTIGSLPLVWYGTPEQKQRYLPKLVTGEWVAAYALSEASAGSDAMKIKTRATLSEDGRHYILNGEKMWISNAGFADLFTVFAKIDGEKFSAFLVERGTPGFTVAPDEHKLGIRGSSTCPLIFSDCKVPVENLLGVAGKGHQIAFNILNVGRYKLATACVGGAQAALRYAVRYGRDRIAFGKPITSFGLIQQKIAESAASIYAAESMSYRVVGAIDSALSELDRSSSTYTQDVQKCIEEFALECSVMKVYGSEVLDAVADHAIQIHGGYGYVEDYPVERIYRDSRINRIFEGTNEINRLIITNWMMKRSAQGSVALQSAIQNLMQETQSGGTPVPPAQQEELSLERAMLTAAKKIALFCFGIAGERFNNDYSDQQEAAAAIAEIIVEVLALESSILRAQKLGKPDSMAVKLTRYYAPRSFQLVEEFSRKLVGGVADGDSLRDKMAILRRLTQFDPTNTAALGREISDALVAAGGYKL